MSARAAPFVGRSGFSRDLFDFDTQLHKDRG